MGNVFGLSKKYNIEDVAEIRGYQRLHKKVCLGNGKKHSRNRINV